MFYGVTGSGKSTAALRFGETTGLPVHLVDDLTWEPGWVQVADEEQIRRISEICAGEEWVLDTAYGRWVEIPLERVELIVGLDYPRWLSLARLTRRSIARILDKNPVCNGNIETWRNLFSSDSIIRWHFSSFTRKRERMQRWHQDPESPQTLLFRRPSDLDNWLNEVSERPGTV